MNLTKIKEWVAQYEHNVQRVDALVKTLMETTDLTEHLILEQWLANTRKQIKGKEEIYEKFKRFIAQSD